MMTLRGGLYRIAPKGHGYLNLDNLTVTLLGYDHLAKSDDWTLPEIVVLQMLSFESSHITGRERERMLRRQGIDELRLKGVLRALSTKGYITRKNVTEVTRRASAEKIKRVITAYLAASDEVKAAFIYGSLGRYLNEVPIDYRWHGPKNAWRPMSDIDIAIFTREVKTTPDGMGGIIGDAAEDAASEQLEDALKELPPHIDGHRIEFHWHRRLQRHKDEMQTRLPEVVIVK